MGYERISRRQFLAQASASAALVAMGGRPSYAASNAPGLTMPIAVFSKVYQELNLSLEESAEVTAQAGLDGIDCAVRPGGEILPEQAAAEMPRYAALLEKQRARMLLLTTSIVNPTSPHAETILRTAKRLGIQYYRLGYWTQNPSKPAEQLRANIKAQLKELAALNREIGVCALFQNHSSPPGKSNGHAGGDLNELYELTKGLNPEQVAVAFDFGHALITHGEEWKTHFEKLKPQIKVAYIKDVKRGRGFVPFGEGEFAGSDIFHELKRMNYQAPLSFHIEFDWAGKGTTKTRPALVKTLADSRRVLGQWLAAA